jgi:acetyl-CoA C-acetyltransferase
MRSVSIVGIGQLPVKKLYDLSISEMGALVVRQAMDASGVNEIDALYVSNMLSDELQRQKHLAALIADEAGLFGIEAIQIRAATAVGAAALRVGSMAVASGAVDLAVVAGVEKMAGGLSTPALAKALDAVVEVPDGATMISHNARLMDAYLERYRPPDDALALFSVNAHHNGADNPFALFQNRQIDAEDVLSSRLIFAPIRLLDCSPICDGAAAVILAPSDQADQYCSTPVHLLGSGVATDRFRLADRPNPLILEGTMLSCHKALAEAKLGAGDIDFFELHDAFSIMACLCLEASGFAELGKGWQLATEGDIKPDGRIPISTMGGLKARGHPIGATALYQACEIVLQLTGRAEKTQLDGPKTALMQSIGGAASTTITHVLGV